MDKSILNSRVSCKNILMTVALLFIMMMPKAQAIVETPATLNGIEVKPLNGSYEITIDADKAVPVKTNSTDRNSLSIELKNITPSKSVNTVYNNAGNIDHILIQPMGQDVKVTVQGMNAGAASVLLDSPKIPTSMLQATPQTEITLNRSIDSYTPITPDDDALDLGNIFSLTAVDFHNLLTPSGLGWLVGLGIIFMVLLRSLINTEKEAKQYSEFSPKDILRQKEALRKSGEIDLKEEITKAQNRFNDSMLRKQGIQEQNASIKNYGIKEYQNSQVNPYKKVSKTPNVSIPVKNTEETTPKLNKLQEAVKAINDKNNPQNQEPEKAIAATKTKITKRDLSKAQTRLNNMKFLENMTRIYEKSGRVDLAQNIKETMKKRST
ncbi:MAG: hypothetical protein PHE78_04715 [Candidatus Gastranaerophilales bacterium]|nr:hypothetical protein [Candidatus Gastranaerophilales bacterium]